MDFRRKLQERRIKHTRKQAIKNIRACRCWFVDIPRTSSSSIRAELGRIFGLGFGKSYLFEKEYSQEQGLEDHLTAWAAQRILGEVFWHKAFTFSFVRNPWDRFLSLYFYRMKNGELPEHLSFKDYVRQLNEPRYGGRGALHSFPPYYFSMSEYLLDPEGQILVDFVGRYENREADLAMIARRLGIDSFCGLHLQRAGPAGRHYSEYYDDESRDIISRVYRLDIDRFGYEFETC